MNRLRSPQQNFLTVSLEYGYLSIPSLYLNNNLFLHNQVIMYPSILSLCPRKEYLPSYLGYSGSFHSQLMSCTITSFFKFRELCVLFRFACVQNYNIFIPFQGNVFPSIFSLCPQLQLLPSYSGSILNLCPKQLPAPSFSGEYVISPCQSHWGPAREGNLTRMLTRKRVT